MRAMEMGYKTKKDFERKSAFQILGDAYSLDISLFFSERR